MGRAIICLVLTLLGLLSVPLAFAGSDIPQPPTSIDLKNTYGLAKFFAPGCAILVTKDPDAILRNSDRLTNIRAAQCSGAAKVAAQLMVLHHEYCPPLESQTQGKNLAIINDYLHSHPNELEHPFGTVIFNALVEAWPCPHRMRTK